MALVQVWRRRYGKRAVQSYAASSGSSLSIREQVFASQIDPGGDDAAASPTPPVPHREPSFGFWTIDSPLGFRMAVPWGRARGLETRVQVETLNFTDFLAREMMLSNIAVDMLRNLKTGKGVTSPAKRVRAGGGSAS